MDGLVSEPSVGDEKLVLLEKTSSNFSPLLLQSPKPCGPMTDLHD